MGTRNRERRAAKAKRRERRRSDAPPPRWDGWGASRAVGPELIEAAAVDAADRLLGGDSCAPHEFADALAGERAATVDAAVATVLTRAVRAVWMNGWLPHDVHQFAQRRLDRVVVGYVVDAVAAEAQHYAAATVHERWREQLCSIDAVVWWEPGASHLSQWAQRHGRTRAAALGVAIEVLAALGSLPTLQRILPLPGSASVPSTGRARRGVDQKILARVRGLLAKAESTAFPEEAEALSAKAQELMSRHALERAVVEAEEGTDPEPASARRLWLDNPYLGAKALLVNAVASANRCRTMLYEKIGFVTVLGDDVDLEIVELLATSLLVQATRAMLAAGPQTRGGTSRTRSYRQSFLVAFATRIRERLTMASDAGSAGVAVPDRLLPVLAARERVVDELFDEMFPHTHARSFSVSNAEGYYAGRAAADLAVLDTRRAVR